MYKQLTRACVAAGILLVSSSGFAANAKFAAAVDTASFTVDTAGTLQDYTEMTIPNIKVASKKDLLIGVSAEVGIETGTTLFGRLGDALSAMSEAGVEVSVSLEDADGDDWDVFPEKVTFSQRTQGFSGHLPGILQSCTFNPTDTDDEGNVTINVGSDCDVSDEDIALLLKSTTAHHFNFIAPDLASGNYTLTVKFEATAAKTVSGGSSVANAKLMLGPRVVTVEEVRATKDGIDIN